MLDRVVAELAVDADPDPRLRWMVGVLLEAVARGAEEPHVHRGPLLAERDGVLRPPLAHQVEHAGALLGGAHRRHRVLVLEALLGAMEAQGLVVDDLAVLTRGHPAGDERTA